MLEGKNVNLKVVEKEELPLLLEWLNDPEIFGLFNPLLQLSKIELEDWHESLSAEGKWFFIEKEDGSKIGEIHHVKDMEIGYGMIPSERRKAYCIEAVKMMVDYLFLSKNTMRIYALSNVGNVASQRVLEKVGFKKEGVIRKSLFTRGEWKDRYLYGVLREEWNEPKILMNTTSQ